MMFCDLHRTPKWGPRTDKQKQTHKKHDPKLEPTQDELLRLSWHPGGPCEAIHEGSVQFWRWYLDWTLLMKGWFLTSGHILPDWNWIFWAVREVSFFVSDANFSFWGPEVGDWKLEQESYSDFLDSCFLLFGGLLGIHSWDGLRKFDRNGISYHLIAHKHITMLIGFLIEHQWNSIKLGRGREGGQGDRGGGA